MPNSDPCPILDWLEGQSSTIGSLLTRAAWLDRMDAALRAWLAEPWSRSIRVVNVRDDSLVVFADSAEALTRLRLRSREALAFLHSRFGLACTRIEVKVRPGAN